MGKPTSQAASAQADLQVHTSQGQAQPREGGLAHMEPSLWYLSRGFQSCALGSSGQSVRRGVLLGSRFVFLAVGIF